MLVDINYLNCLCHLKRKEDKHYCLKSLNYDNIYYYNIHEKFCINYFEENLFQKNN